MSAPIHRVGIVGVGLIGGSFGLALRRRHPGIEIRGFGRDPGRLEMAREVGAVDRWYTDLSPGLRDLDLVFLATPVRHILGLLGRIGADLAPGTLVTDAGSTKRSICDEARRALPAEADFVGGHPVAGREVSGVEHSLPELFKGAPWVLCQPREDRRGGLSRLRALIESIGGIPVVMSPEEHDAAVARVSHLPQLLSTLLANAVKDARTEISGAGLRDMLRLARSPYEIWEDILATNADNIDAALADLGERIEGARQALRARGLGGEFAEAADLCRRLSRRG